MKGEGATCFDRGTEAGGGRRERGGEVELGAKRSD